MATRRAARRPDILADPFGERAAPAARRRLRLLGIDFEFECESLELRRLVDWAYAGLPRHRLGRHVPRARIRLALAPRARGQPAAAPAGIEMRSGAGLLCATTSASDFVVMAPEARSALVVISRAMLDFAYTARYELLECAVFTLAARVQSLMPLHAACVGDEGRCLLLVGSSGAGKSTASLHWLLRGREILAEDSVFVTPDSLLATGVSNFLHVRCDSLQHLPRSGVELIRRSPVIRRRSGVRKFEIDLRRRPFRVASCPLAVVGLVFLSAQAAPPGQLLSRVRGREAAQRFTATQPYAASRPAWGRFRRNLGSVPAFELRRGRGPEETIDVLQELLARQAH